MALTSETKTAAEGTLLPNPSELQLTLLSDRYSVARFDPASFPLKSFIGILSSSVSSSTASRSFSGPGSIPNSALVNLSVTPSEISLVCPTLTILSSNGEHHSSCLAIDKDWNPQTVESGWLALRVDPSPSPSPSSTPTDSPHPVAETEKSRLPPSIDFSVVGLMARISGLLAKAGVSIFAVSTYDTDYILVKEQSVGAAVRALREDGCRLVPEDPESAQWRNLWMDVERITHHESDS